MPGLFGDNMPGGILGMLMGNYQAGGLATSVQGNNPATQEMRFRQQAAQSLGQQYGPGPAAQMIGAPDIYKMNAPQFGELGVNASGYPIYGYHNIFGQTKPIDVQGVGMPPQAPLPSGGATFTGGPTPPNVDPRAYRAAEAKRVAEAQEKARDMAIGSLDFLPQAHAFKDKLDNGYYHDAIGPLEGQPWFNQYVRAPLAAAGVPGQQQGYDRNKEFTSEINRLSAVGLKAQYGSRPSLPEVQMNKETFGPATASEAGASNILTGRINQAYESLNRGLQAGLISPSQVPADVRDRGIKDGKLDPRMFGMKSASPSGQPQTQVQPSQQPAKTGSFNHDDLLAEARRRGLIK